MLRVNEIFYSIQGEGAAAGRPCVFVRLTGCNLRCSWCDTEYAFHEGTAMSVDQVLEAVRSYGCALVELTGGEPLLQDQAADLMSRLLEEGYEVLLETGNGVSIGDVPGGVHIILDLKCPGSGEEQANRWDNLDRLPAGSEVKLVIRDRGDYLWAAGKIRELDLASRYQVLLAPVHGTCPADDLAAWMLDDGLPARLQIQLHKILWPDRDRGV